MSEELRYKGSITDVELSQWKLNEGYFDNERIVLKPGGSMQLVKAPKDDVDKAVSQKYKVVITYNTELPTLNSTVNYMFEMYLTPNEKDGMYKGISTSAHPNTYVGDTLNQCVTYVDANGGIASQFKIIIRNLSDEPITVNSVAVYPSYAIDDSTLSEMEQYMPSILHYTNMEAVSCKNSTRILAMDVSTTMDTNLNVHLLLNGTSSFADDVTLEFKLNGEHLLYSPLEFTVPEGKFLIGIPANIMQVESGNQKFEVYLISNSTITFNANKIQCTVDGKGMVHRSNSAAPSAFETVTVPRKDVDMITVGTNSISNDVDIPILYATVEHIPIKRLNSCGSVEDLAGHELVRVAEDVWFGPVFENGFDDCENELFNYNNNVIYIDGGKMQLKNANATSVKFHDVAEYDYGNIYAIELDNSDIREFERLDISPTVTPITITTLQLNANTLDGAAGYDITKGINILIDNEFTSDVTTSDDETYTYAEVTVDESIYNDIGRLE